MWRRGIDEHRVAEPAKIVGAAPPACSSGAGTRSRDEREADAVIPVGLLRNIAPSGLAAENPKLVAIDSRLREVQVLRKDVQRAFTGAKAKNVRHYAD